MTDTDKPKYTKEGIKNKIDETDDNEFWYTDKLPTVYDWSNHDADVFPRRNATPHSTHISYTVVANGDESNGIVERIARGLQLLAVEGKIKI